MDMRDAAESYCLVIENVSNSSRRDFVERAAVSLSSVIAVASELAWEAADGADAPTEGPQITHEQWKQCYNEIQDVLDDWDNYWTTSAAYEIDESTRQPILSLAGERAVNLSLADALADVWRDLRNGLNYLEQRVPLQAVTWEWRFSFLVHWGSHATDALRALHAQRVEFERFPSIS